MSDRVWIAGADGADNNAYHVVKHCERGPEDPITVPYQWVADDSWHACAYCSDREVEYPGTNDMEAYNTLVEMDPNTDLREVANR